MTVVKAECYRLTLPSYCHTVIPSYSMDFSHLSALLSRNPALAIPLVFAGGVLTSLTPCIYPMIPITAAIVGGSEATTMAGAVTRARWRPLGLTLTYVVGLAFVYSVLGLVAGLTGTLFGTVS